MKSVSDELYQKLKASGVNVLIDDRSERTGVKFKDMDLIGIPIRVVVGTKNLPNVEVKLRGQKDSVMIAQDKVLEHVQGLISEALQKLSVR